MASFVFMNENFYKPEHGGVDWFRRLNNTLEIMGVEIVPIAYTEDDINFMQVTPENTILYTNTAAPELDCIAVNYELDDDDLWTFYFRNHFNAEEYEKTIANIGMWTMHVATLYPIPFVVEQFEKFEAQDLDHIPDDWK